MKNLHIFRFALPLITCSLSLIGSSQNVAINTTGRQADPSALVDMSSNSSGFLPPRMTTSQMSAIAHPAQGLIVLDTVSHCLMMYLGSSWQSIFCACATAPGTPGIITGPSSLCAGTSGVTYSIAAIVGASSYSWSVPSGDTIISGQGTASVKVTFRTSSGNISVTASNNCGTSLKDTLPVTVNIAPAITGQPASPPAFCDGNGTASFTITATGSGLTYQWQEYITSWNNITNGGVYSGATSSTLTLTNPPASMNGYMYQCIVSGTCTPGVTSNGLATLTINPIPTITSVTPGSITGGGAVTLGATASAGTINWYANATGGSSLATGSSFTTPPACTPSTTTYYVDATANGCTTATRTSVTATVTKVFQVDPLCSLTTGLISYWEMEGNSNDFYGSNNGSDNSMSYSSSCGKVNQGACLNGSSSYIAMNNMPFAPSAGFTISLWFKYNGANSGNTYQFFVGDASANYRLGMNPSFNPYINAGNRSDQQYSSYTFSAGQWYYYTLVGANVSGTNYAYLYINGNLVNTWNMGSYSFYGPNETMYIGRADNGSFLVNGSIDEVGIWNRALTAAEITALYNGGAGQTMH